jgi:Flp pilus assembly protein TadG
MNYHNGEKGQAILLVVVVMGIVLIGAMGLVIDVSQLFGHQQMAQVAADAAAQAAMLSIFQGVNTVAIATNPAAFSGAPGTSFTCAAQPASTPCKYAQMNGFGSGDTITVSFSTCALAGSICGAVAAGQANQVTVVISRPVSNSLIRMVGGPAFTTTGATGIAAVLSVVAPVPILILHPSKVGALSGVGTTKIVITGGPSRSIQVNSSNRTNAYNGNVGTIDLHLAGPDGTGADFAVFGGPAGPNPPSGTTWLLGTGTYSQPASPMKDPLLGILPPGQPSDPSIVTDPPTLNVTNIWVPNYGCADPFGCTLYRPGRYSSGINQTHGTAIFQPGVYVMANGTGFGSSSNGALQMCVVTALPNWPSPGFGCVSDPNNVTGDGMLVYNEGGGLFSITGTAAAHLKGTPEADASGNLARYGGMLFFEDRASPANNNEPGPSKPHVLGGNGCIDLIGTIYATNTLATMSALGGFAHYQEIEYHGTPCSGTIRLGMVITDVLTLKGTADLSMQLSNLSIMTVQQVALIGGGPHS